MAGIERAVVYGSWAARFGGEPGDRPVGDIDLLVLGDPDRNELFEQLRPIEDAALVLGVVGLTGPFALFLFLTRRNGFTRRTRVVRPRYSHWRGEGGLLRW